MEEKLPAPAADNGADVAGRKTKKGLILDMARRDPFLSVQDIARAVSTTDSYVRTALSERSVSLRALRTQVARHMERELLRRDHVAQPGSPSLPPSSPSSSSSALPSPSPPCAGHTSEGRGRPSGGARLGGATVEAAIVPGIARLLGLPEAEPLVHVRRILPSDPLVVEDVYSAYPLSIDDIRAAGGPDAGPGALSRGQTVVRVVETEAREADPRDTDLLLVVETVLFRDGRPFAVERKTADARAAELALENGQVRFARLRR